MPIYPRKPSQIPVEIEEGGTGSTSAADATEALGVGATDTPGFAGINLGNEDLDDYDEGTFTPTVTLVGGTGNTVPEYSTNSGRYTRIGRVVFVSIRLSGATGDAGAGTGNLKIALPITVSASWPGVYTGNGYVFDGTANEYLVLPDLSAGADVAGLIYWSDLTTIGTIKGENQSGGGRTIKITFWYEV